MFFEGTLQEGIVKAVQEQKRVVCFVCGDDDESGAWQQDYLQPLSELLGDHAVVLKLQHGTPEAGYLAAISPIEAAPTVVVIYNGQVQGALRPPMAVDEFRKQILTAMGLDFTIRSPAAPQSSDTAASAAANGQRDTSTGPAAPVPPSSGSTPAVTVPSGSAFNDALAQRRRRMAELEAKEAQRKQKEAEAKREAAKVPGTREAHQAKLAEEARKKRQAAADEKARVLERIEADKLERRQRAETEKAVREALRSRYQEDLQGEASPMPAPAGSSSSSVALRPPKPPGPGGKCRLQLRFNDGRVERADFSGLQTLGQVREWIGANIEPQPGAFTLREVTGVGVARQFEIGDEKETLHALGLVPSATLIVRAAPSVSSKIGDAIGAASGSGGGLLGLPVNIAMKIWSFIVGIITAVWGTVMGFVGADHRAAPPSGDIPGEKGATTSGRSTGAQASQARFQTLEERNKKRDKPTLYNGNQLGVLPNADQDDEANDEA